MRYRLSCPSCGKSILVSSADAGQMVLCGACGARVNVPPGMGVPGELTPVPHETPAALTNPPAMSDLPEATLQPPRAAAPVLRPGAPSPAVRLNAPARTTTAHPTGEVAPRDLQSSTSSAVQYEPARQRPWLKPTLITVAVVLALGLGLLIGIKVSSRSIAKPAESNTAAFAANERDNSDLLKLKAEAEELTLAGRLREAHAKYRQLATLGAGREFKSPLMWDIMERAKVDQDRVYWILMAQMEGAEKAFANGAPGLAPSAIPARPTPASQPAASAQNDSPDSPASPNAFWGSGPATNPTAIESRAQTTPPATTPTSPPLPATRSSTAPAVAGGNPDPATRAAALGFAPLPKPPNLDDPAALDADIDKAIRRGSDFLLAQFKNGALPKEDAQHLLHSHGLHALCTYALVTAGQAVNDERLQPASPPMAALLDRLRGFYLDRTANAGPFQPVVYARSLRLLALSVHNRTGDRQTIAQDLRWLLRTGYEGRFSYDDRNVSAARSDASPPLQWLPGLPLFDETGKPVMLADGRHDPRTGRELDPPGATRQVWDRWRVSMPPAVAEQWLYYTKDADAEGLMGVDPTKPFATYMWDNSNTHLGLLAVWQATTVGGEVPNSFWVGSQKHWTSCALPDGQWPYTATHKHGSSAMNLAGITALSLMQEVSDLDQLAALAGAAVAPQQLTAGLKWLETGDNCITFPAKGTRYVGYDLFSLERAATATGFKYFGTHDWYRELARRLIGAQRGDGAWGAANSANKADAVIDTAFTVLFLCHGRQPVMANKLRFEGKWTNRPRDLAGASRYVGRMLERPLGWQVVNLNRDGSEWLDAPILYIASDVAPKLSEPDRVKIHDYVEAGGMLLLHADNGRRAFNTWAEEFTKTMWPAYELRDLPDDHDLYNLTFKIPPGSKRPKLRGVSNGARLLAVVAADDLAGGWLSRDEKNKLEPYQIATNLYVYATGKTLPSRLVTPYIEAAPGEATTTFKIARLKFDGNWDPEPGGWKRFSRIFRWETGAGCEVTSVPATELPAAKPLLAHLTGTGSPKLGDADVAALKSYVESGGVLLIDPAGGDAAFFESIEKTLLPTFAGLQLSELKSDLPPLGKSLDVTDDLTKVDVRQAVAGKLPPNSPYLRAGKYGQGWVIISRLDITSGLLGTQTWSVIGFSPNYAKGFMKNLVLWAATQPR